MFSSQSSLRVVPEAPLAIRTTRRGEGGGEITVKKVQVLVVQSCRTLCDHTDHSPPGSSVHGISQVRILEQVAISFLPQGIVSTQGSNLHISCVS